jgi:hypothetical protein
MRLDIISNPKMTTTKDKVTSTSLRPAVAGRVSSSAGHPLQDCTGTRLNRAPTIFLCVEKVIERAKSAYGPFETCQPAHRG